MQSARPIQLFRPEARRTEIWVLTANLSRSTLTSWLNPLARSISEALFPAALVESQQHPLSIKYPRMKREGTKGYFSIICKKKKSLLSIHRLYRVGRNLNDQLAISSTFIQRLVQQDHYWAMVAEAWERLFSFFVRQQIHKLLPKIGIRLVHKCVIRNHHHPP